MEDLNFRQLFYFWTVTQERSVTRASRKLKVAQPTISTQLKKLETSLGTRLFRRRGRSLELTETGQRVQQYAEQIFTLGRELWDHLQGKALVPRTCRIGISHNLPGPLIEPLLSAACSATQVSGNNHACTIFLTKGNLPELCGELIAQRIDVVLGEEFTGSLSQTLQTHSRLLIEAPAVWVSSEETAKRYRRGFPGSLQGAPLILPQTSLPLRHDVNRWLEAHRLNPPVVVESNDEFWRWQLCWAGYGVTVSTRPTSSSGLAAIGQLSDVVVRCFAHTLEQQPSHPLIQALFSAGS